MKLNLTFTSNKKGIPTEIPFFFKYKLFLQNSKMV